MQETSTETPRGERRHSEIKDFLIELTEERREQLGGELATEYRGLEAVKAEKKESDSFFNSQIKAFERRCSGLSETLDRGSEETPVTCEWWYDYTNGVKRLHRPDTGEIVETRPLTPEERQTRAAFEDDQHPDDEEEATVPQPWEMPGELEQLPEPERLALPAPEDAAEDVEIVDDEDDDQEPLSEEDRRATLERAAAGQWAGEPEEETA